MTREISVELQNVSKYYGTEKVVDEVSFSVEKGEIFVLIGPSGCGKTTTLKMINQLIPHTSGNILVNGVDVTKLDAVELRRSIGYVIQYIGLLPHLTIQENIAFVLKLTKKSKKEQNERALELVETVGLQANYLKRYPRELSGGQQQRVGVARALAANPDILLMDEPFGAVDPLTREQLQNELLRLQESIRKTIVFVTHDMQEAFKVGSRIGILRQGKLVCLGTPMEIVRSEDEFVKNFIGQGALFEVLDTIPVLRAIEKDIPIVSEKGKVDLSDEKLKGWENIFVTNDHGQCLGYISLDSLNQDGTFSAGQIEPLPAGCSPEVSVKQAVEEMLWKGKTWLPVISEDEGFKGIVLFSSCADLLAEDRR
ncbi:MAG: ABC transporter ATP-binding protein [Bacillota bacterium]|nr:ABC transporter ATP-binding protein [Bacillota bacterium]MDW7730077.1 ABC transporter ATP-binding protein [Bacillota bacterium]